MAFLSIALALAAAQASAHPAADSVTVTLRSILEAAAGDHPAMQAARARLRAAYGSQGVAGAFGNPVLSLEVENARLPGRPAPPTDRETMATATLPLEPFYQRGARVRQASADVRASAADTAAERRNLALAGVGAWSRMALAQVVYDTGEDLVAWLDSVAAYNRARVGEGAAAEADLLRAELERDRASAETGIKAAELAAARASLRAFLGDGALTTVSRPAFRVDVPLAPLPFAETAAPGLSSFESAPEVVAARERSNAAAAAVSVERLMLVPDLGAMVGVKRSAGTSTLLAGVSLPFPLFTWNRGGVARARGEQDAAAATLVAERRAAGARLEEARAAALALTERAQLLVGPGPGGPGVLARAEELRRISLGAYREGAVPLFGVIDAVRASGEARIAFFEALLAQHEGVLRLEALRGADLLTLLPPSPQETAR
jgi:cobalt-zinc-cadmium efflux system outer membrane protein